MRFDRFLGGFCVPLLDGPKDGLVLIVHLGISPVIFGFLLHPVPDRLPQLHQKADQNAVAAGSGDCQVKFKISGCRVFMPAHGLSEAVVAGPDIGDVAGRCALGGKTDNDALQLDSSFDDLTNLFPADSDQADPFGVAFHRKISDMGSLARLYGNQPDQRQRPDSLSDRASADLELPHQLGFGWQPIPRLEPALGNELNEPVGDLVCEPFPFYLKDLVIHADVVVLCL